MQHISLANGRGSSTLRYKRCFDATDALLNMTPVYTATASDSLVCGASFLTLLSPRVPLQQPIGWNPLRRQRWYPDKDGIKIAAVGLGYI
jgi:hypothetical protein